MFKKAAILNIAIKIFGVFSQLVLAIFTNRILAPEGRGVVAALSYWNVILFTIGYCSLNIAVINSYNKDTQNFPRLAGSSSILSILLGAFSVGAGLLLYVIFPQWFTNLPFNLYLVILIGIPLTTLHTTFATLIQIKGKLLLYNLCFFVPACTNIVLVTIVILGGHYTIAAAVYLLLANYFITFGVSWYFLKKAMPEKITFTIKGIGPLLKLGLFFHFATIATFVTNKIDLLMINSMIGEKDAGIYFLATTIASAVTFIPMGVQSILYPKIAFEGNNSQFAVQLIRISKITLIVTFSAVTGIILLANPIIRLLGGSEFLASINVLRIYILGVGFTAIPVVLASYWNSRGFFRQMNISAIFMMGIVVLSNYLLIGQWGVMGAALSFVVCSIFMLTIHLLFVHWYLPGVKAYEVFLMKKDDREMFAGLIKDLLFFMKKR